MSGRGGFTNDAEVPKATRPSGIVVPEYAPGLHVETARDLATFATEYHVGLRLERVVILSDEAAAAHYDDSAGRELVAQAVRQMQDEAVTALGLNHWKAEIRREVEAEERRQRRAVLVALRDAVRVASTTDRAALLIQDEIDALGVA